MKTATRYLAVTILAAAWAYGAAQDKARDNGAGLRITPAAFAAFDSGINLQHKPAIVVAPDFRLDARPTIWDDYDCEGDMDCEQQCLSRLRAGEDAALCEVEA